MAETRMQKYERFKDLAGRTVRSSAITLAQYGMDPDLFAEVTCEALLANPDIMNCTEESIAKALRAACQDGLVPNGREAAIWVSRDRQQGTDQATYLPMKEGMARLAWESLQAELHTGVIREGDEVLVAQGAGIMQNIEIKRDPFREKEGEVKGCYLWCHLPFEKYPRLVLWRKEDIDRRRAASRTKSGGPWETWYAEKAQTSICNHFLRSIRHLITSTRKSRQLITAIDADTARDVGAEQTLIGTGEVIDVEPAEVVNNRIADNSITNRTAAAPTVTAPVDDIPEPSVPKTPPAGPMEQSTFLPPPSAPAGNSNSATDL